MINPEKVKVHLCGKKMKTTPIIIIIVLALSVILLISCSSENGNNNPNQQNRLNPDNFPRQRQFNNSGNMRGGFQQNRTNFNRTMNISAEQRQQMTQQRLQQSTTACNGKSDGDSCTISSQRGDQTGTCRTQNNEFICNIGAGNRQRNGQGNWNNSDQS
jgi:hypothetical protein